LPSSFAQGLDDNQPLTGQPYPVTGSDQQEEGETEIEQPPRFGIRAVSAAAFWSVGNAALGQIVALLAFLVTARLISPAAFGLVGIATLCVEIMKRLFFESVATRLMAMSRPEISDFDDCFTAMVTLAAAGTLILLLVSWPLAWLVGEPELTPILQLIGLTLLAIGLFRTHEVLFTKRLQFKQLAVRQALAAMGGAVIGVTLSLLGFGVWALVAQQLVASLVALVSTYLFSDWRPHFRFSLLTAWRKLVEARRMIVTNSTSFVSAEADLFFVTSALGAGAGGIFSAAKRLILAATLVLVNSLGNMVLTAYARSSNSPRAYKQFLGSLTVKALLLTPLFFGLSVLGTDLVTLLLGPKWTSSGPILSILALTGLGQGIASLVINYLLAGGAERMITLVATTGAIITLIVLAIVAPLGASATAYAVTALTWLSFLVLCGVAVRMGGGSVFDLVSALWLPTAGAAGLVGAAELLSITWSPSYRLFAWPPLLLATYVLTIGLLGFGKLKVLRATFR
jgi:O-antigen/teichoic acid export membrane protein